MQKISMDPLDHMRFTRPDSCQVTSMRFPMEACPLGPATRTTAIVLSEEESNRRRSVVVRMMSEPDHGTTGPTVASNRDDGSQNDVAPVEVSMEVIIEEFSNRVRSPPWSQVEE